MKIPSICRISTSREDGVWGVHRSVDVQNIVPDLHAPWECATYTKAEGLTSAFDIAIEYTKMNIAKAKNHLERLEQAKSELDLG